MVGSAQMPHKLGLDPDSLLLTHPVACVSQAFIFICKAGVMIFIPTAPGRHSGLAEGTACSHKGASFQIHFY